MKTTFGNKMAVRAIFGAVLVAGMMNSAQSAMLYDLNHRIDGGNWQLPQGTSVGSALFENVLDGDGNKTGFVDLTLQANQTAGGWIQDWCFTLPAGMSADDLSMVSGSLQRLGTGTFQQPTFMSSLNTSGLGQYQLSFGFDFGSDANSRFNAGDIFKVRLGTGFTELDFANGGTGGIFTALQLQGLDGNPSAVKIANVSGPEMWSQAEQQDLALAPEAGTLLAGVSLIGLCAGGELVRRRRTI